MKRCPVQLSKEVQEGQQAYTRWGLTYYRFFVLGFSNRLAWRCSTSRLLKMYDAYVSENHLDVGVGTGYYVANCRFPTGSPRLGLMDVNRNSLDYAAGAARRYEPEIHHCNVLETLPDGVQEFDSISMNYLLHCLPGSLGEKSVVFDNLAPLLTRDGVLFGSTVVQDSRHNAIAKWLLKAYNERGHFHNSADTASGLERALRDRFDDVDVRRVGSVALFCARKPVKAARSTNGE